MTRIIDNIENLLGDHLTQTLEQFDRMDVAVGYFNLRGWRIFEPYVRTKETDGGPVARILIGMALPTAHDDALNDLQDQLEDKHDLGSDPDGARAARKELVAHLRDQLSRGLPTAQDRMTLHSLRQDLEAGRVQVKVFTARPLHGKTFVFHRDDLNSPIVGFVGSSNLTAPGLTSNLELNVDVVDFNGARDLANWFEDRWNDPMSRPIDASLLELIDESWATPIPRRPYEVFLKVCYEMARDVREGSGYGIPAELVETLLPHQATAVTTLARRVETKGGAMLGDVVGFGKTLIAVGVALTLRDALGYQPLILCPKNLKSMWEEYLATYDLYGLVVTYPEAARRLPSLRQRYQLVIVDESQTLRNSERQDYQAARDYIRTNQSRVLLLTATPYNTRFLDVANQLGLYLEDHDDLGIAPTHALALDPRLADRVDGKITTLAAFRRSEIADDWKRLMSDHLVRRTRGFIKQHYAHKDETGREYLEFPNGRREPFPVRVPRPIEHSFGADDPAVRMEDPRTLTAISKLRLPRYRIVDHVDPTVPLSEPEKSLFDQWTRGRGHVAGFVRTMFFKRLSSCGHSFLVSLRRHVERNGLFIYALENGLPLPTGSINDHDLADDEDFTDFDALASETDTDIGSDSDIGRRYQSLQAAQPRGVNWVRADIFKASLLEDLRADTEELQGLLQWFGPWSPDVDSKLQELIKLLTVVHPEEKVLVFTEYKDTATYIGEALHSAGIERVGVATGDTDDPTRLAHRFAPKSNEMLLNEPIDESHVLRVLVATDVLSEGQNLQDAHIIVNFDLPWAIVRLIQRAGRVDRIGQAEDEVFLYSFFHKSLDSVISLRQRIAQRLRDSAEAFGSDEEFFGSAGETVVLSGMYSGEFPELDDSEDVDAASLAFQYWDEASQSDPDLAKKIEAMPDLVDATRSARPNDGAGIVSFIRTAYGADNFIAVAPGGDIRQLTGHEAIREFFALPDEAGKPLRDDHDDLVHSAVREALAQPANVAGRLRGVRLMVWNRIGGTLINDTETDAAVSAMLEDQLTTQAEGRLKRALGQGVDDDVLREIVTALHRDGELVKPRSESIKPAGIVASMGVVG